MRKFSMRMYTGFVWLLLLSLTACGQKKSNKQSATMSKYPISKTDEEWKNILTPDEFAVLRNKGTERSFTSDYNAFKGTEGDFLCKGCKTPLFKAKTKFDSGSGWPSFFDRVSKDNVQEITDSSHGMLRTEVVCGKCGGHLGHVFDDGPKPTGLRYCINGVSIIHEAEVKK